MGEARSDDSLDGDGRGMRILAEVFGVLVVAMGLRLVARRLALRVARKDCLWACRAAAALAARRDCPEGAMAVWDQKAEK